MKRLSLAVSVCLSLLARAPAHAQAAPEALALATAAIEAQGGERSLRRIESVRVRAMVHEHALEQSVRPEGPYYENFSDLVELRRPEGSTLLAESRSRGYRSRWWREPVWTETATLVTGGAAFTTAGDELKPTSPALVPEAEESLALGPERALLTALAADDLRRGAATLHGAEHDTLHFTWSGHPVTIYLSKADHMPAAVELRRALPLDIFWSPWGDVISRTEWDAWTVEAEGLRYPRRWTTFSNGQVQRSRMIDGLEINPADAALPEPGPDLIAAARAASRPIDTLPFSPRGAVAVAPGVTLYVGPWNVTEIVHPGGVYVVEAPISSGYSRGVMEHVAKQGPVLGVISTSDAWPHVGGLRQYAAAGTPIYALDLNAPLIGRILAAPFDTRPDDLARQPRAAHLRLISNPTTIGRGADAFRILPFRSATGERQMALYWPAHRLLYTSDLIAVQSNGLWLPQGRDEVAGLIAREVLDVETVFGMHYGPVAWADVLEMEAVT